MNSIRCHLEAKTSAIVLCCVLATASGTARADDYRRPGLEGKWSRRHLTAPMNSLRILAGPGQPMLLGDRFGTQNVDAGGQYVHSELADPSAPTSNQTWLRGGVAFGLTEDWEAGALFVPFQLTPHFDFSNITVFVTRGFRFENWDLGVRLSFQTPSLNANDKRVWILNPGVPFLYRAGAFRIDSGVFVPFATRDWWVGLTVPLRVTVNPNPHFFLGLESGFVEPRFDVAGNATIPLGALVGYTELFGNKVVDFTAMFSWDRFWVPGAPKDQDTLELGLYRVGLGVVIHSLVK
jgi:hypothetical protein